MRRCALLLCFAFSSSAYADEEGGVRFAWIRGDGAESCPSATEMEAEVVSRLGRDPFQRPFTQTIEGYVRRGEDEVWVLELRDRDEGGQLVGSRRLTSRAADCVSLASAVALSTALAIDPDNQEETQPPPSPRSSSPPALRLRVGAVMAGQMTPTLSVGPELRVDTQLSGILHLTLGMLYVPERRDSSERFGFGLTAASAGLCLRTALGRAFLGGCAGVSVGALHAVVYDLTPLSPGAQFYSSADVTLEASLRLAGPLFLAGEVGASVPFVRYRFFVEGTNNTVFQQGFVIPRGAIAVGVHFP